MQVGWVDKIQNENETLSELTIYKMKIKCRVSRQSTKWKWNVKRIDKLQNQNIDIKSGESTNYTMIW